MWLRRPEEESAVAFGVPVAEGLSSTEVFPVVGRHDDPPDNSLNYNKDTGAAAAAAAAAVSSTVLPNQHGIILSATDDAPSEYRQQECTALLPPGSMNACTGDENPHHPPPPSPPRGGSLLPHISEPHFPFGNPDDASGDSGGGGATLANAWHASFDNTPPERQEPQHQHHQHHQTPLPYHHIPGIPGAGPMSIPSPAGDQFSPSPVTTVGGASTSVGLGGSCCCESGAGGAQAAGEGVARALVGHAAHEQGGGGGQDVNVAMGDGNTAPEAAVGKDFGGKAPGVMGVGVPAEGGTPEALGMQKLSEHKHWAALYIKPNTVYKRRKFSSLKERKRRDLVAAGFNAFHKICESISHGEPEMFMAAVLNSTHAQKVTKGQSQENGDLDNIFLRQQALAYKAAPTGPNGRTRVLTTMTNLMSDKAIQRCFHRENGRPPSAHEISLARKQYAATGAADQPPPLDLPPAGTVPVGACIYPEYFPTNHYPTAPAAAPMAAEDAGVGAGRSSSAIDGEGGVVHHNGAGAEFEEGGVVDEHTMVHGGGFNGAAIGNAPHIDVGAPALGYSPLMPPDVEHGVEPGSFVGTINPGDTGAVERPVAQVEAGEVVAASAAAAASAAVTTAAAAAVAATRAMEALLSDVTTDGPQRTGESYAETGRDVRSCGAESRHSSSSSNVGSGGVGARSRSSADDAIGTCPGRGDEQRINGERGECAVALGSCREEQGMLGGQKRPRLELSPAQQEQELARIRSTGMGEDHHAMTGGGDDGRERIPECVVTCQASPPRFYDGVDRSHTSSHFSCDQGVPGCGERLPRYALAENT